MRMLVTGAAGFIGLNTVREALRRGWRVDAVIHRTSHPELDALAEASHENPSLQFRKVLWQISNALKVGSDVGEALEAIVEELTRGGKFGK